MIASLLFSGACSSGGGTTRPRRRRPPSTTVSQSSQTAIPDGVYRTRPRTEQDLVALGLTKRQIEFAKTENELWKKTIVYELRISGDQFVLFAPATALIPSWKTMGRLSSHGHTLDMMYVDGTPEYTMRF